MSVRGLLVDQMTRGASVPRGGHDTTQEHRSPLMACEVRRSQSRLKRLDQRLAPDLEQQFRPSALFTATSDFGMPAMRSNQISLPGKYMLISVAEISSVDATCSAASVLSLRAGSCSVFQC